MDWLDSYLDELSQSKNVEVPPDVHYWGKKPVPNNVQKKMMFEAMADTEKEHRKIIEEARRELEDSASGYYDGAETTFNRDVDIDVDGSTVTLPVNIDNVYFVVQNNVISFDLVIGNSSFTVSNNFDVNNFNNCNLQFSSLVNTVISPLQIFVGQTAFITPLEGYFTINYTGTGSALFNIQKAVLPAPTPSVTPTISITPTRTVTPTVTPTITITPTISITPTRTVTPTVTRTPTVTPTTAGGIPATGTSTLRVQIPSLSIDDYFYNNGSNYFNGTGCGSEDSPITNEFYYSGSHGVWYIWMTCNGVEGYFSNSSGNSSIIPTSGWIFNNQNPPSSTPINIIFTVIN